MDCRLRNTTSTTGTESFCFKKLGHRWIHLRWIFTRLAGMVQNCQLADALWALESSVCLSDLDVWWIGQGYILGYVSRSDFWDARGSILWLYYVDGLGTRCCSAVKPNPTAMSMQGPSNIIGSWYPNSDSISSKSLKGYLFIPLPPPSLSKQSPKYPNLSYKQTLRLASASKNSYSIGYNPYQR